MKAPPTYPLKTKEMNILFTVLCWLTGGFIGMFLGLMLHGLYKSLRD